MFGVGPILVAAVYYLYEGPDRKAAQTRDAWRTLLTRPSVEYGSERELARNWGAVGALETLVANGAHLHSLSLSGADLSRANLPNAQFGWSNFRGSNFVDAHLQGASFRCTDLRSATFIGAAISGVDFSGANITGASFGRHPDISDASLKQMLASACVRTQFDDRGDEKSTTLANVNITRKRRRASKKFRSLN